MKFAIYVCSQACLPRDIERESLNTIFPLILCNRKRNGKPVDNHHAWLPSTILYKASQLYIINNKMFTDKPFLNFDL